MKLNFSESEITEASPGYIRVRVTESKTDRLVKEGAHLWLEIGAGPWAKITRRSFVLLVRKIIRAAKEQRITKLALQLNLSPFPQLSKIPLPELGEQIAVNLVMANFEFLAYKTPADDNPVVVEEVLISGNTPKAMQDGFKKGQVIGEYINTCRALANTPGGDMTPTKLADAAKNLSKGLPIKVEALGPKEMTKLGMGAVLGVARGSTEEPRFIIMEYKGSKEKPIVLVGKGVTFDSGGLNIKTDDHMYEMHMDMSGGAAALSAVAIAAKLSLKKHVIALVPAVENMSAGDALRPGDILKSLSGKTIEVLNTDAEGRLILADALFYAKRLSPSVVIDAATLTGSAIRALGPRAIALFAKDDTLANTLETVGEESGDYVWRMPLWDEYEENVKGSFADFANLPESKAMRNGDAINAAAFLYQFAKEIGAPWAHLDIAPRMTSIEADRLAKGAAGSPVRLFVRFIEQWTP